MQGKPVSTAKRPWTGLPGDFRFEVAHIGEPANNMDLFHWHDFMELSYVKSGSGAYEIEDKVFSVSRGDVVIINNIEKHRVTYDASDPLYETVVHFDPALIWSDSDLSADYKYLRLFRYKQAAFVNRPALENAARAELGALFSGIEAEYRAREPYFELMIKSKILTVITLLLRRCGVSPISSGDAASRRSDIERLEAVLRHIQEGYAGDLGLEAVARAFYMNPTYFSEYFKKNVGVNFSDYLARVRVGEAMKLLLNTADSATDVAFAVGFRNAASFYNAFRRQTGMSPGEYRARERATVSASVSPESAR